MTEATDEPNVRPAAAAGRDSVRWFACLAFVSF
jgi:hypothetical protein